MPVMDEDRVYITYIQYEYEETEIQIYDLFYKNGIWFWSAYGFNKKPWRTYRCDYIIKLIISKGKQSISRKELEDIKQLHDQTFNDIPFKCKLTTFGIEVF